jgi:hypothetical protein
MSRRARAVIVGLTLVLLSVNPARSQLSAIPTPAPTVTAERESWYLKGEPITFAGHFYYPAGAEVFFNPNEMVRSGFFKGIPLYTRTTIEPYAIVYVPLPNGRMQPYARQRTKELTGTASSVASAELPRPPATVPPPGLALQAQGPLSQTAHEVPVQVPRPAVVAPLVPRPGEKPPSAAATTGQPGARASDCPCRHEPVDIYIDFEGARWYAQGAPAPLDPARQVRIGTYHGFDVWANRGNRRIIYIPVTAGSTNAVAYSHARPRGR